MHVPAPMHRFLIAATEDGHQQDLTTHVTQDPYEAVKYLDGFREISRRMDMLYLFRNFGYKLVWYPAESHRFFGFKWSVDQDWRDEAKSSHLISKLIKLTDKKEDD